MTAIEALAELVACKDLKTRMIGLAYGGFAGQLTSDGYVPGPQQVLYEQLAVEYARRKPPAWAAARAVLASPLTAGTPVAWRWSKAHSDEPEDRAWREGLPPAQTHPSRIEVAYAPGGAWRDMKTAPRDGTEVILRVALRAGIPGCCLVGHYMEGGHCIEGHPAIAAGWYFWTGAMFDLAAKPEGWLPLPQPVPEASPTASAEPVALKWSEIREPGQDGSHYHHVDATTPFGRLRIDWKGWKETPSYGIEGPDWLTDGVWPQAFSLDGMKAEVERIYRDKLDIALAALAAPAEAAVDATAAEELDDFKCPECGGDWFRSGGSNHEVGYCKDKYQKGCRFTWDRVTQDREVGLVRSSRFTARHALAATPPAAPPEAPAPSWHDEIKRDENYFAPPEAAPVTGLVARSIEDAIDALRHAEFKSGMHRDPAKAEYAEHCAQGLRTAINGALAAGAKP